jgi:DNA-binding CsgD family transcriptional regulator
VAARPLELETAARKRLPPSRTPAFRGCILTRREFETIKALARGLSYAQAAEEVCCSTSTVRSLLQTAYQRLGVSTIAQALAVCTRIGWLDVVPHDGELVHLADRRVTWAQRLYLEAFDQALRAGDDANEVARTGVLRDAALTGMYREADKERPWRQAGADPLERLAHTLRRLSAREERAEATGQVRTGPWNGAGGLASVDA